jgi:O-antigen ligase
VLLAAEVAAGALLAACWAGRAQPALAPAVAAGSALILAELAAGGPLTQALRRMPAEAVTAALSNGTTVMVLLAAPAAAQAWRGGARAIAASVLVLAAAASLLGGQIAARLGLAAGVAGALAALVLPPTIRIGMGAASALVLGLPLLLPLPLPLACRAAAVKLSVTHRIFIWNFAEAARAARPWTGWGIETARAIPGGRTQADLWTPCGQVPPAVAPPTELLPLHTHNAALQVWLELGPAGAIALCLLLAGLALRARARDAAGRAAQAATFAAAVVIALSSYGAWQGWWIATLAIALAAAGSLNPPR